MSKIGFSVEMGGTLGEVLRDIRKQWPALQYGLMSEIGYTGRRALYENFLRGQVIDLTAYPFGKDGQRRTVSYKIYNRMQSVSIRAYPLNLFKPRSVYANATPTVEFSIKKSLAEYDRRVLQARLKKLDKDK